MQLFCLIIFLTASVAIMSQTNVASHRADDIYRTGPENLIAQSSTILAGPVSQYTQTVESRSEGGADSIPLKWVVSGILEKPQVLKGLAPAQPLPFSRSEQSIIVPRDRSEAIWERTYGELSPDREVVIFLGDTSPESILKVLPSGAGEQNLIRLVKDIVQIQAIADQPEQLKRWLSYLRNSTSDMGRTSALRSFIGQKGQWVQLAPILEPLLMNSQLSSEFHAFAFGIVAFNVTQEKWGNARDDVLRFLCRRFSEEHDPRLAIQYVYSLGLIFNYCDDENFRRQRRAMRQILERCLDERRSLLTSDSPTSDRSLDEQYQALRARYLRH